MIVAFVISRWLYLSAGSRFTVHTWFMQFLDPNVLRSNFWQSLFYLHSQPPILDFMLGAGLKLFPSSMVIVFQVLFAAMGLAIALIMLSLMTDLGVPCWLALVATLLFEVGPATLMFENWFYNTYPTIFFLCLSAFCLNRFLTREKLGWGNAFTATIALPVFLDSTFQIVWFIGAGLILLVAAPEKFRRLVPVSMAFLVLMLALYAKNLLVFGVFTTSSWLGMNLSRMTTFQLPQEEREALVRDGKLSLFALTVRFPAPSPDGSPPTGVPALDEVFKQQWPPSLNYNNIAYIHLSKTEFHDAMWVLRHRPAAYARGLAIAAEEYFQPAADLGDGFRVQKKGLDGWISLYDLALVTVRTQLGFVKGNIAEARVGFSTSIVLFVSLTLLSLWAAVRAARIVLLGPRTPEEVTLLFVAITVLYVGLTGIALNCGENNRLRFVADPFYVVLGCIALTEMTGTREKKLIGKEGRWG